jgi:ribosomal protein L11 methyltransferase
VTAAEAEPARAVFVELFPQGFEERELAGDIELAAYTDDAGEARVRERFAAVTIAEVEPGWGERWREFHRPVRIGPLWIGPPWETPPADAVALFVEPARAFGTGGHATTRLCLELLVDLRTELAGASVLDLGCGSGVLSIAAARLGYGSVLAVDVAPEAIGETRRNARANGVEVEARLADALTAELPTCDLVVANIARPAVEALAPRIRCRVLVASGYLEKEPVELPGFRHRERRIAEGWAADVYERAKYLARSRHSGVTGFPLPCL